MSEPRQLEGLPPCPGCGEVAEKTTGFGGESALCENKTCGVRYYDAVREPPETEPERPDDLPNYLIEGLERQKPDALRSAIGFARARLDYLEAEAARPVEPEEIGVDEDEEVIETKQTNSGTIQKKKIPCGKNCGGCPHGPYRYRYYRKPDGSLTSEYLGKA